MTEKEKYMARLMHRHCKQTGTNEGIPEYIDARLKLYDGFGETHTAAQWSRLLGIPRTSLWRYLKKGLTIEEAVRIRRIDYPAT